MGTAEEWIERLGLQPLEPEGGYYRESHCSDETLEAANLPVRYATPRAFCTAIYYLLTPDTFSAMHKLESDEVWAFVAGDPAMMLQLYETGTGREVVMSNGGEPDAMPQLIVPRRVWQGSRLVDGGRFALFSITMSPGFDKLDFEPGRRDALLEAYPAFHDQIMRLTREPPPDPTPEDPAQPGRPSDLDEAIEPIL